ncbi:MAG TPA: AAA family ATPase, partial [Actinomycetota bacterium]|nr:AAA family ATPase [Actinomycetota bacterium]
MLRELHLSGLGVIEDVELELDPGLNVLTGETGAGKTMVTVGLALALGRRASATLVRAGADAARVQARFDAVPADVALPWGGADGELVLARTVASDGRSTARIGAELAPVSALAALAGVLVEVHGQHEGIGLLSPAAQLAFVDRWSGREHLARVDALHEAHARLRAARERLDALRASERDRERELDLLAYQVGEIERVAPRPGELAELETEHARLAHAERLLERSSAAERSLDVDEGAGADLTAAAAELAAVADLDRGAAVLAETARSIAASVIELTRDVRAYRESLDLDPGRLAEVDERLAAVRGLLRRYGDDENEVLGFLDEARARIELLTRSEESRVAAEADVAAAQTLAAELTAEVGAGRAAAAPHLAAAVQAELRDLGMPDAAVEVEL